MPEAFRNIERGKEEITRLHKNLLELEWRIDKLRGSLRKAITEVFRAGPPGSTGSRLQECSSRVDGGPLWFARDDAANRTSAFG
jgi:hypothetical protein